MIEKIKKIKYYFQADTASRQAGVNHYLFKPLGHVIISHNHAHVTIPLTLTKIRQKLNSAHNFSKMLLKLTKKGRFSDDSEGALILKALSSATDSRFEIINNLYESAIFFGTENKMADTELTFTDLKTRNRKSLETFLPSHIVRSRTFPNQASNNAMTTILGQRRSYEGAKDANSRTRQGPAPTAPPTIPSSTRAPSRAQAESNPDPEPEDQDEAEAEAEAEGSSEAETREGSTGTQTNNVVTTKSTTTITTTTTTTTSTRPPGHLNLQDMYGQIDPNNGQVDPNEGQVDSNVGTENNGTIVE